ncbi:MAG TPA: hypothetical protein VGW96_01340 [Candidatus Eremiobacteraceae bacterium]|nr:hypothetical protein [Candidatus Eremiobacteraceae bacterium]
MNGRSLRSLPAGALTIALLFIAATAFAAGNYAFAPPQGWTHVRSGTESKWLDPTGGETLKLFQTSYAGDLNSFVNRTLKQERSAYPTQYVWNNKNYSICGRHTGRYVIWTASTHGRSMVWEQLFALWGYDGYIATYTRPQKDPPSNAARGSLVSICGVGSAPEQPGGVPVTPQNPPPAQNQPAPPPEQPTPNPTGTIYHPYVPVIPNG